jgi:hypothetical protein
LLAAVAFVVAAPRPAPPRAKKLDDTLGARSGAGKGTSRSTILILSRTTLAWPDCRNGLPPDVDGLRGLADRVGRLLTMVIVAVMLVVVRPEAPGRRNIHARCGRLGDDPPARLAPACAYDCGRPFRRRAYSRLVRRAS